MRIKFDKDSLPVEQNNYLSRIVNVYIIYNLDVLPRNPRNNVKLKNCLVGATNVVKNSDKEKSMCIVAVEQYLIVQVHGVLIMSFLGPV